MSDSKNNTQNTEDTTKIDPSERLIESMNPTLGEFCKTFYKQHIKLLIKLTYSKQRESKHADILCKVNEVEIKDQIQHRVKEI